MSGRGILSGSAGAVIGAVLGGVLAWAGFRRVEPGIEPWGPWLLELRGPLASVVLAGAGVGLFAGCALALAARRHRFPLLSAVLVLGFLPFATPLVRLAGRLGWWAAGASGDWWAAGVSGIVAVVVAVAAARWLVTGLPELLEGPWSRDRAPRSTPPRQR